MSKGTLCLIGGKMEKAKMSKQQAEQLYWDMLDFMRGEAICNEFIQTLQDEGYILEPPKIKGE